MYAPDCRTKTLKMEAYYTIAYVLSGGGFCMNYYITPTDNNNSNYRLTHWGRDKMDAISQTTFSNAFSWMKMYQFRSKFHWSLFLRVQLTIFHHGRRQAIIWTNDG